MKSLRTSFAVALAALTLGSAAQAAPAFSSGESNIFFRNAENLYRLTASCTAARPCMAPSASDPALFSRVDIRVAGNIFAGDVFAGILDVQTVTSNVSFSDTYNSAVGDRFTGYFAQQVLSTIPPATHVDPFSSHLTLGTAADPFGILAAGEMFRLYTGGTYSIGGTVASGIANAIGGAFWGSLGLPVGTDGYVYSHTDLTVPGTTTATINFLALDFVDYGASGLLGRLFKLNDFDEDEVGGLIAASSTQLCSAAEIASAAVSCTDIVGESKIGYNSNFGNPLVNFGAGTSPWQFTSDDPLDINLINVPEPGSLALLGLALAGLGLTRRRRAA